MTHLNIQQGQNIEVVSTNLIKKLYEAALSVPEPLEGEQDAAYMSGNLQVNRTYRSYVQYLTGRFNDLHINVTDSYYIPFEDSAVLNVLLANNIGSDSIGVTEAEATNSTLTSAMFKNNTDITSFDEFKYFTKANTNPPNQLFMGCSNLSSVDLSNVTTLSSEEFRGTAITSVDLTGSTITSIPNGCFRGCTSLTSVTLSNLTNLGNNVFQSCTGITSIDFTGSTFTAVGASAFRGCSNLTKLVLPTTVTTVGNEWVVDIPRQITVEGTDNIANYGTSNPEFRNPIIGNPVKTGIANDLGSLFKVFGNNTNSGMSLHSLYEPLRKNTPVGTFIQANQMKISLFWNSSSNSANANIGLYYLKDIETFGYMTFYGTIINNLIINNVTPPTLTTTEDSTQMGYTMYQDWGNVIFRPNSVIGTLWVPDSAVATYQADPLYSGLTIKGINTKTNGVDYDLPRYATYADWKTAEAAAVAQGGHAPQGLIEAWM